MMTQIVGVKPLVTRGPVCTSTTAAPVLRLGKTALPCRRQGCVRVTAFTDRGASGLDVKVYTHDSVSAAQLGWECKSACRVHGLRALTVAWMSRACGQPHQQRGRYRGMS